MCFAWFTEDLYEHESVLELIGILKLLFAAFKIAFCASSRSQGALFLLFFLLLSSKLKGRVVFLILYEHYEKESTLR